MVNPSRKKTARARRVEKSEKIVAMSVERGHKNAQKIAGRWTDRSDVKPSSGFFSHSRDSL